MRKSLALGVLAAAAAIPALSQPAITGPVDPLAFSQLKDFRAHRSSSNSRYPDWNDDSAHLFPGETLTIADLEGPGIVTHIWTTSSGSQYGWPRLLRIRAYYDGSDVASVDAPLGDFFAVGHGLERAVKSLMIRDSSDGRARNSYWPMPFRKRCRITVTNEGSRYTGLYYHVDWQKMAGLPPDTAYFHARYRQELPAPADGSPYVFLETRGRGFYVGTVLNAIQAEPGWFGEGDDMFYVDGEKVASIQGTGSEDYFNDAWGLHVTDGDYAGVTVADGEGLGSRMTAYRWHLTDPVPFTSSLRVEIEHKGWTYKPDGTVRTAFGVREDLMSSVAYWYQQGIAADQPSVPYGRARLPQGNALQIELEATLPEAKMEGGTATIFPSLFWGKDVIVFGAEGPGSRIELPFDVPADGEYELQVQVAQASDYGAYRDLARRKAAETGRARTRTRRRHPERGRVRRVRLGDLRRQDRSARLAAPDEGPAHADVHLHRQALRVDRLQGRNRQRDPGPRGQGRVGEGGRGPAARVPRRRRTIPDRATGKPRPRGADPGGVRAA